MPDIYLLVQCREGGAYLYIRNAFSFTRSQRLQWFKMAHWPGEDYLKEEDGDAEYEGVIEKRGEKAMA